MRLTKEKGQGVSMRWPLSVAAPVEHHRGRHQQKNGGVVLTQHICRVPKMQLCKMQGALYDLCIMQVVAGLPRPKPSRSVQNLVPTCIQAERVTSQAYASPVWMPGCSSTQRPVSGAFQARQRNRDFGR